MDLRYGWSHCPLYREQRSSGAPPTLATSLVSNSHGNEDRNVLEKTRRQSCVTTAHVNLPMESALVSQRQPWGVHGDWDAVTNSGWSCCGSPSTPHVERRHNPPTGKLVRQVCRHFNVKRATLYHALARLLAGYFRQSLTRANTANDLTFGLDTSVGGSEFAFNQVSTLRRPRKAAR